MGKNRGYRTLALLAGRTKASALHKPYLGQSQPKVPAVSNA